MKWEKRKKKWKINHEYRRVLTLDKIMGEILQEWKEKDKVSVVRCKDCKYWQDNNGGYPHEECRWGKEETPDGDDFCSYGERREP